MAAPQASQPQICRLLVLTWLLLVRLQPYGAASDESTLAQHHSCF